MYIPLLTIMILSAFSGNSARNAARNTIKVKLQGGILPTKAYKNDAGFDLYTIEKGIIKPGVPTVIDLGLNLELPRGTYAKIENKSSMGKNGLIVLAGIIDEGYRGNMSVVIQNLMKTNYEYLKGQKIAQLIMHPYHDDYQIQQVININTDTERGIKGFGSSETIK